MIATIFHKIFRNEPSPGAVRFANTVLNKWDWRSIVYILGLVFLTILAFGISLDGFFVADDMWQVNYADEVTKGKTELIWRNFTSNYLQIPSLDFYRPLLGFTFIADYLLYRVWSPGYHLTNLLLYISSVVLLFILIRRLTRTWPLKNSQSAAYFGAALFAVSPLHCEDVCWISGRADILCAPFYLLSIWCVVKSHQERLKKYYVFGLIFYILAMFSKEIGIGLPLVVFAYYLVWPKEEEYFVPVDMQRPKVLEPDAEKVSRQQAHLERVLKKKLKKEKKKKEKTEGESDSESEENLNSSSELTDRDFTLKERFWLAFKTSIPFGVAGLIYLAIRYAALGTIIGGYTGMIGTALDQHFHLRWFNLDYITRILIPIPEVVQQQNEGLAWTIAIALVCCLVISVIRVYGQADPRKWLLFLVLWIVSCSIPLLKLWGIGKELETSRLLFFFSMGYSTLWPVLMFHPTKKNPTFKFPLRAEIGLGIISTVIISTMIVAMAWAAFSTSCLWYTGGQELKEVWTQTTELARKLPPDKKFMLIGIPKDFHGAHISFNGSTFHHMLRPPFVDENLSTKVVTFDPYIVGPFEVVNATRFKFSLLDRANKGCYYWDRSSRNLEKLVFKGNIEGPDVLELPFKAESKRKDAPVWKYLGKGQASVTKDGHMLIKDTGPGDGLRIEGLNFSPLKYDFVELDIKVRKKEKELRRLIPLGLTWNHDSTYNDRTDWVLVGIKLDKFEGFQRLTLRPSHFWRWYTRGPLASFLVRLPDKVDIEIKGIRLVTGKGHIPYLFMRKGRALNSGEYVYRDKNEDVEVFFDASMIEGAAKIQGELSKPNYFYDNFIVSEKYTAVGHNFLVELPKGVTYLKSKYFKKPAYYQLRIRALDKDDKPLGQFSDPITILRLGKGLETYIE